MQEVAIETYNGETNPPKNNFLPLFPSKTGGIKQQCGEHSQKLWKSWNFRSSILFPKQLIVSGCWVSSFRSVLEATENRRQEHVLFLAGKNGKLTARHIRFSFSSSVKLCLLRITTNSGHGPFIAVYSLKVTLYPLCCYFDIEMGRYWVRWGRDRERRQASQRKEERRRHQGSTLVEALEASLEQHSPHSQYR